MALDVTDLDEAIANLLSTVDNVMERGRAEGYSDQDMMNLFQSKMMQAMASAGNAQNTTNAVTS